MRVLIVHRYFWPENTNVFPQMLREIVHLHLARGDTVRVVAGLSDEAHADYGKEFGGNCRVFTFRAPIDRRGSLLRRVLNNTRLLICALRNAGFGGRWDVVYTVSYPPLLASTLSILARRRHLIYYFQDGFLYRIRRSWIRAVYLFSQRIVLRRASRVVTLSQDMKAGLVEQLPEPERPAVAGRIRVIQNFAPEASGALPEPSPPARDIIYAGNHGIAQNLRFFLDVLVRIEARPRVAFFGDGTEKRALADWADAVGMFDRVTFHDPVGAGEIAREINRSRFGLVGAVPGLMGHAFPSKLLSYAVAGVPSIVMCPEDSATSAWLVRQGFGYPIDPEDPAKAARQFEEILAAPPADRNAIRAAAEEEFGRERFLAELSALLDELD